LGLTHIESPHDPGANLIACQIVRIDDVVEPAAAVSLIKLDVEGAEFSALRGASTTIERWRPNMPCEVSWRLMVDLYRNDPDELHGFFTVRGYDVHKYHPDTGQLVPLARFAEDRDGNVCGHSSRKLRRRT
jgi:hypothetical protein